MLMVLRSRERAHGVSVNALGYAGSLFVRDDAALQALCAEGPLAVLRAVGVAAEV
jgi:ATP adenylyltransferase